MRRSWLVLFTLLVAGCYSTEVSEIGPEVVGERRDAQGKLVEQLVRDATVTVRVYPLTPEGPHRRPVSRVARFSLVRPGQPQLQMTALPSEFDYYPEYWPVSSTNQWVGAFLQ